MSHSGAKMEWTRESRHPEARLRCPRMTPSSTMPALAITRADASFCVLDAGGLCAQDRDWVAAVQVLNARPVRWAAIS